MGNTRPMIQVSHDDHLIVVDTSHPDYFEKIENEWNRTALSLLGRGREPDPADPMEVEQFLIYETQPAEGDK